MIIQNSLPEDYKIPKNHQPVDKRDFEDNGLVWLTPDSRGKLTIINGDGDQFRIEKFEDFVRVFKNKYNWTFSRLNELDCLFKIFPKSCLLDLRYLGEFAFKDYKIFWNAGTAKIRIQQGNNTRTSKYLINIDPFLYKHYQVTDLDHLSKIVGKILGLNTIIALNMTSPAATVKDLILGAAGSEFYLFNKLDLADTRFIHSAYVGPRMESKCLGTISNASNLDLVKAYLRKLGECPSINKYNILKIFRGSNTYYEEAHPGSVYEVEVDVPETYGNFAPIPLRSKGRVLYPTGKFTTKISKPYMETIRKVGDIPYTLLDAVQIIPNGKPVYPFAQLSKGIEEFEDKYQDFFDPINLKALHYSVIGHMLHIHRNFAKVKDDEHYGRDNYVEYYEASQDYNPVIACAVQGMVANEIWQLSQVTDSEAIRVDALTGYNLEKKDGYKKTDPGMMTFLTPALKDKPGTSTYRDLIERDRDMPAVRVSFPYRTGIKGAGCDPKRIGIEKSLNIEIRPQGGSRYFSNLAEPGSRRSCKRVGELLDNRFDLLIPNANSADEENRDIPYWVDDYLHIFPQDLKGVWGWQK